MDFKYILEATNKVSSASAAPIDNGDNNSVLPQGAKETLKVGTVALKDRALEDFLTREEAKLMTHVGVDADGKNVVMWYGQNFDNIPEKQHQALTDYLLSQIEAKAKIHKFKPVAIDDKETFQRNKPAINNNEPNSDSTEVISNIQKVLARLSPKSLNSIYSMVQSYENGEKRKR